jgi:hypothetical protein
MCHLQLVSIVDEVECDVLPLEVCGLLLGRPWQYDHNAIHARRSNTYYFMPDGIQQALKPIKDDQITYDVVLVVRKEKLNKAKPQPRLAMLQHEEHDARSVNIEIVSAMPIDDKPVVFVSDKPVKVKPLIDESKGIATCVILPICVEKGVQTDDSCVDRISVHMVTHVEDHSFVRTPMRHFVGAAVRMHKGKTNLFVSCVARALLLFYRVIQRRSMFNNKGLHGEGRRR